MSAIGPGRYINLQFSAWPVIEYNVNKVGHLTTVGCMYQTKSKLSLVNLSSCLMHKIQHREEIFVKATNVYTKKFSIILKCSIFIFDTHNICILQHIRQS
jgi:hypothetical protein